MTSVDKQIDVSSCFLKIDKGLQSHTLLERALWTPHIEDFGLEGDSGKDVAALMRAKEIIKNNESTSLVRISNNTTLSGDPSDLIGNDSLIFRGNGKLVGFGRYQAHAEYLPSPSMFPPNVRSEHLEHFHMACSKGFATVVFWGDSINSIGGDLVSTADYPVYWVTDAIQKANPTVQFTFVNLCIPSLNWADMSNELQMPPPWMDNPDKLSWIRRVASYKPDLIINHSAGNDGWNFDVTAFKKINDFFENLELNEIGHIPSIVYGITYQPSIGPKINNNNYENPEVQQGIDYCATYIRNWCIANNRGFLDYGRWHAMCRDGIDPRTISMERVSPKIDTTLPDWGVPVDLNKNAMWEFPNIKTESGVNARHCTSFLVCFTINENPKVIQVALSNSQNGLRVPKGNDCFIITSGNNVVVEWTDGNSRFSIDTNVAVPDGVQSWIISLKDSRLVIELQNSPENGWNYENRGSHIMGMGYVTVFDRQIARFGAAYTPRLNFARQVVLVFHNFTVADATAIEQAGHRCSCNRYTPIISNKELYEQKQEEFGGSGSYHGNIYLHRIIMSAVAYAQSWQMPHVGFLKTGSLEVYGENSDLSRESSIYIGKESVDKKGVYFLGKEEGELCVILSGNKGGGITIKTTNENSSCKNGILARLDSDSGNFLVSGLIGMNGVIPSKQTREISGAMPSDPVLRQILEALSELGMVKDKTI